MEKIINEFRVIETDDGYRIEIEGDKEKLKDFISGFGGSKRGFRRFWRKGHFGPGPFGFAAGPMMWGHMASCCGPWDFTSKEAEETEEESKV